MQLKPGTLLQGGKYKIVRFIKSGGFGCTYEALHTVFGNRVAIKEFFPKDFCNRDADTLHVTVGTQNKKALVAKLKSKFIDEAVAIHNLSHVGIVKVSDVFEENCTAYYVMDYIDGCSLDDLVKREGALSEQAALGYIRQVCSALDYVHSQNRLHLDIKPGNIMVDSAGHAILIDFGTSKQYDEENGENTSTLLGMTPGYAPMEQYNRGGLAHFTVPTDIYALAATLYKLMVGRTPPEANMLIKPDALALPSGLSANVSAAIRKSMLPLPEERPQSVSEFLELLNASGGAGGAVEETLPPGGGDPDSFSTQWENDLRVYSSLIEMGDEYINIDSTLSQAKSKYEQALTYEMKYSGTKYAEKFSKGADKSLKTVESRIKANEEARRKRNEISYTDGILRVKDVEYPMVYVSGGSFDMGATSEQGRDAENDEEPVHRVTLSSYSIGKYEITQELWEAVMGSNPSYFKGAKRPVEQVSWDDCQDFIRKLNELTGASFRLPTEAEWEFAARGGNSSRGYKYSGSDTLDDVAWYYDNSIGETHHVGTKSPNELGLHDMSGNVWEWCSDRYGSYSNSILRRILEYRVFRGGSWDLDSRYCRVSFRNYRTPGYRSRDIGFRLCHWVLPSRNNNP